MAVSSKARIVNCSDTEHHVFESQSSQGCMNEFYLSVDCHV
jgi:hypothetical protein